MTSRAPDQESVGRSGAWVGVSSPLWRVILPWLLVGAALFVLALRSVRLGGYFPDDAFITWRFAEHLAQGHGLVWNIGGGPVEGSTSPLHVLLLAIAFKLGVSFATGAYAISLASLAGLIAMFHHVLVRDGGRFGLEGALALALYIAGVHLTVHVNAGMETMLFTALITGSYLASISFVTRPGWKPAVGLAILNFVCLLGRPDAAPFLVGQGLILAGFAVHRRLTGVDRRFLLLLVGSFALLIVPGIAYLAWKYEYFGYILPNSYYIKASDAGSFQGVRPVWTFLRDMAIRSGLLVPLLLFVDWRKVLDVWRSPLSGVKVLLLLVPPALFLLYNTTVLHLAGFNWRFEFPAAVFIWLAVGKLLSVGQALDRLNRGVSRFTRPLVGTLVAGAFALAVLTVSVQRDRKLHRYWFRNMQLLHYDPIASALLRTGAGPNATLVFDSAGYIAFKSRFSHIDPIGLTDNVLSGRRPITPLERENYIWGSDPDVYLGPVPQASPGATDGVEDPLMKSVYVQEVLLRNITFDAYRHIIDPMSYEERREVLHVRMRELRDRWVCVGEIPYPYPNPQEYTHFLYVRRDSPYAGSLQAELRPLTTRNIEDIDFDDLLEGQRRHDLESIRRAVSQPTG